MYLDHGDGPFQNELQALENAYTQFGSAFTDLIVGLSVGSEDLYRASSGQQGDTVGNIQSYLQQAKSKLKSLNLGSVPLGHVDTWGAWTEQGSALLQYVDFVGIDAYPYFQGSSPDAALSALQSAVATTQSFASGKQVWITETGWPVSGATDGSAVPSVGNAQAYWKNVGCTLFGNQNTWWFTLNDAGLTGSNPSFGITSSPSDTTPLFDLSC